MESSLPPPSSATDSGDATAATTDGIIPRRASVVSFEAVPRVAIFTPRTPWSADSSAGASAASPHLFSPPDGGGWLLAPSSDGAAAGSSSEDAASARMLHAVAETALVLGPGAGGEGARPAPLRIRAHGAAFYPDAAFAGLASLTPPPPFRAAPTSTTDRLAAAAAAAADREVELTLSRDHATALAAAYASARERRAAAVLLCSGSGRVGTVKGSGSGGMWASGSGAPLLLPRTAAPAVPTTTHPHEGLLIRANHRRSGSAHGSSGAVAASDNYHAPAAVCVLPELAVDSGSDDT